MRLCAQAHAKYNDTGQRLPFTSEEKQYYNKVLHRNEGITCFTFCNCESETKNFEHFFLTALNLMQ